MFLGFPVALVSKLSCQQCGGALHVSAEYRACEEDGSILEGKLCCNDCDFTACIVDGIVNMIEPADMDAESRFEQTIRDEDAQRVGAGAVAWYNDAATPEAHNAMEMLPTIEAMALAPDSVVLELGCGDGRFTLPIAYRAKLVLGVDFSIQSLRMLRRRLPAPNRVGLVLADITKFRTPQCAYTHALSTLVSNLPSPAHRQAMYRLAAYALQLQGKFVFTAHHHSIRERIRRVEKSGRYGGEDSIYRYNFAVRECKDEVQPYFHEVRARPIQIYLPLAAKLRLPLLAMSRLAERIPVLNHLGCLVLCVAQNPSPVRMKS